MSQPSKHAEYSTVQFSSVDQSCPTLCDPMNHSTPGLPVHHHLPEFTQTRVHLVRDAIQPSSHLILGRPLLLLPPIPPSIRVFSNESTLHMRWPKYWSFSFSIIPSKEIPGLIFRMDWLDLLAVQGTLKSLLQHHSSNASILWCSGFFTVQLTHPYQVILVLLQENFRQSVCSKHFCNSITMLFAFSLMLILALKGVKEWTFWQESRQHHQILLSHSIFTKTKFEFHFKRFLMKQYKLFKYWFLSRYLFNILFDKTGNTCKVFLMHTKLKRLFQGKQFGQFLELWAKLVPYPTTMEYHFVRRTSVKLWVFGLERYFLKGLSESVYHFKEKDSTYLFHVFGIWEIFSWYQSSHYLKAYYEVGGNNKWNFIWYFIIKSTNTIIQLIIIFQMTSIWYYNIIYEYNTHSTNKI